jgi:predicted ATPase
MREFIGRAATERPLLLVFEDLHWADESTLLLLEYLALHVADMPVVLVGTFRDDEVEPSSPLARIINQLVRERLVTRITLRPLTEEGVAALVAGLAGQQPPAAFARAIYAQSEGNPFFAEEIYLHLAESGVLFDGQGRFRGDLRIEDLDVPASVRMVVGERLARLSPATQRALVAAAVRGRVFELDLVERVAGEPGGDLLDAFDEAERARLITPSRSESSSYTFTHELIRQTLLADASTVRQRRLHVAIAAALEAIYADDLETHAADLAWHLARGGVGGQDGRLVRYLRMAGDRAMETAAYAEAVDHFARAVSLLERTPERPGGGPGRPGRAGRAVGHGPAQPGTLGRGAQGHGRGPPAVRGPRSHRGAGAALRCDVLPARLGRQVGGGGRGGQPRAGRARRPAQPGPGPAAGRRRMGEWAGRRLRRGDRDVRGRPGADRPAR